jgi:hypothetical protein
MIDREMVKITTLLTCRIAESGAGRADASEGIRDSVWLLEDGVTIMPDDQSWKARKIRQYFRNPPGTKTTHCGWARD